MINREAIANLKAAMQRALTLGELYALMEDYSYQEFMAVYNQLPAAQQLELDKICDRDTTQQIAALNCLKTTAHQPQKSGFSANMEVNTKVTTI
jgi:hypothetical protein